MFASIDFLYEEIIYNDQLKFCNTYSSAIHHYVFYLRKISSEVMNITNSQNPGDEEYSLEKMQKVKKIIRYIDNLIFKYMRLYIEISYGLYELHTNDTILIQIKASTEKLKEIYENIISSFYRLDYILKIEKTIATLDEILVGNLSKVLS